VGASAAGLVFLIAPLLVEVIGGQTVTATELRQLVGSGALELTGYFIMGLVVIVIAALCMLTSRLGVFGILNART
jgi:cell division transport system permease protein